ncbi:MAG: hypothetical protein ACM3YM_03855 [Sphingomonadales bacterium]
MHLLRRIERHLRASGTAPSRFGRDAVGDPGFVTDLRSGRQPRAATVSRVITFLDEWEGPG